MTQSYTGVSNDEAKYSEWTYPWSDRSHTKPSGESKTEHSAVLQESCRVCLNVSSVRRAYAPVFFIL